MLSDLPEGFVFKNRWLDGQVDLYSGLIHSVPWKGHVFKFSGREVPMPRLTAWYGNADYTYSGMKNSPLSMTPELIALKDRLKAELGVQFNSVLLNLYRDKSDSVSWHSDDERELGPEPVIASISLGATRNFRIRNKVTKETHSLTLTSGSLLVMSGRSQRDWEHCVPKEIRSVEPRINLTFRYIR